MTKKGLIHKTLERCRSLGSSGKRLKGSMTVYVGPDKERFVIRTDCVNHPLFQKLLEEAETEFGYARDGPIELPCDVEHFDRVMWEMDEDAMDESRTQMCSMPASPARGFLKGQTGYRVLNPSPLCTRMSVG